MSSGLSSTNSAIVTAFQSALLHQGLVVLALLAVLAVAWNLLRAQQLRRAMTSGSSTAPSAGGWSTTAAEPPARKLLRVGFGVIWLFDGILQGQAQMPLGLATQVVQPTEAGNPGWLQHLVGAGVTIWNDHPITAATATVWIQVGIGLFLLVAPRGNWSRIAGTVSLGWGLLVWIFGESLGDILAPGLSWMFGAPGAAVFYCIAGGLIAAPDRIWSTARTGRLVLASLGAFLFGMAVLQAWPGRGFWQGQLPHNGQGSLDSMVSQMAQTPQPAAFAKSVSAFASFDASHGFAVNLFVVVALAVLGAVLVVAPPRLLRPALVALSVLCLADWVLVQDFGFFGGVGTDPNSMIPMLLVVYAGALACSPVPLAAEEPAAIDEHRTWRARIAANPTYAFRSLAALVTVGVIVLGAAPMAVASTNPNADPIVAQAIDGVPDATNAPTPNFDLVDQYGRPVTLADLRGKVLAITFLDPVCVSDCPTIAQEYKEADRLLGSDASRVELVAIVANPLYRSTAYTVAFDQEEGLTTLDNWAYLTGSERALENVWDDFGVSVAYSPGGAMIAHSDVSYVVDANGRTRYVLDSDPGPGTTVTKSSFAVTLSDTIKSVLG